MEDEFRALSDSVMQHADASVRSILGETGSYAAVPSNRSYVLLDTPQRPTQADERLATVEREMEDLRRERTISELKLAQMRKRFSLQEQDQNTSRRIADANDLNQSKAEQELSTVKLVLQRIQADRVTNHDIVERTTEQHHIAMAALQAAIEDLEADKGHLKREISRLKGDVQGANDFLEARSKVFNEQSEGMAKQVETLQAELVKAGQQIKRAHFTEAEYEANINELRKELGANEAAIYGLKKEKALLEKDMEDSKEVQDDMQRKMQYANTAQKKLEETIHELQAQELESAHAIEVFKRELKAKDHANNDLQRQVKKLAVVEDELATLRDELTAARLAEQTALQTVTFTKRQVEGLEKDIKLIAEDGKRTGASFEAEKADLLASIDSANKEAGEAAAQAKSKLKEQRANNKALQAQYDALSLSHKTIEHEHAMLLKDSQKLSGKYEALEINHDKTLADVKSLTSELSRVEKENKQLRDELDTASQSESQDKQSLKQLTVEREQLKHTVAKLERELEMQAASKATNDKELQSLTHEKQVLSADCEQLRSDTRALEDTARNVERENKQLTNELSTLSTTHDQVKGKLHELELTLIANEAESSGTITGLKKEVARLENDVVDARRTADTKLNTMEQTHRASLHDLQSQHDALVARLQQEKASVVSDMEREHARALQQVAQDAELKRSRELLAAEQATSAREEAREREARSDMLALKQRHQAELRELTEHVNEDATTARNKYQELSRELQNEQKLNATLRENGASQEAMIGELKLQVVSSDQQRTLHKERSEAELAELRTELLQTKRDLQESQHAHENVTSDMKAAHDEHVQLTGLLTGRHEKHTAEMQAQLNGLNDDLEACVGRNDELVDDCKELAAAKKALEEQVESLQEAGTDAQQEFVRREEEWKQIQRTLTDEMALLKAQHDEADAKAKAMYETLYGKQLQTAQHLQIAHNHVLKVNGEIESLDKNYNAVVAERDQLISSWAQERSSFEETLDAQKQDLDDERAAGTEERNALINKYEAEIAGFVEETKKLRTMIHNHEMTEHDLGLQLAKQQQIASEEATNAKEVQALLDELRTEKNQLETQSAGAEQALQDRLAKKTSIVECIPLLVTRACHSSLQLDAPMDFWRDVAAMVLGVDVFSHVAVFSPTTDGQELVLEVLRTSQPFLGQHAEFINVRFKARTDNLIGRCALDKSRIVLGDTEQEESRFDHLLDCWWRPELFRTNTALESKTLPQFAVCCMPVTSNGQVVKVLQVIAPIMQSESFLNKTQLWVNLTQAVEDTLENARAQVQRFDNMKIAESELKAAREELLIQGDQVNIIEEQLRVSQGVRALIWSCAINDYTNNDIAIYDAASAGLCRVFNVDKAALFLLDGSGEKLITHVAGLLGHGGGEDGKSEGVQHRVKQVALKAMGNGGILGSVVKTREPLRQSMLSPEQQTRKDPWFAVTDRHLMVAPLLSNGKLLGLLAVSTNAEESVPFTDDAFALLQTMCKPLEVAVSRIQDTVTAQMAMQELESKITMLNSALYDEVNEKDSLKKKIEFVRDEALHEQKLRHDEELQMLQREVDVSMSGTAELQTTLDVARRKQQKMVQELKTGIQKLEAQHKELQHDYSALELKFEHTTGDLDADLQTAHAELAQTKRALAVLEQEVAQRDEELDHSKVQMSRSELELAKTATVAKKLAQQKQELFAQTSQLSTAEQQKSQQIAKLMSMVEKCKQVSEHDKGRITKLKNLLQTVKDELQNSANREKEHVDNELRLRGKIVKLSKKLEAAKSRNERLASAIISLNNNTTVL